MPNWCSNVLKVREDVETSKDELYDFLTKAKGTPEGEEQEREFCFSSLVPRPDGVDWYDWNVQNWGTKWDVNADVELQDEYFDDEDEGAVAIIRFDTAWSPPIEFIQKVAPMFPTLTFELRFWEGGMGFAGRWEQQGDEVLIDTSYGTDAEEYWNIITEDMTEEEIEDMAKEYIEQQSLQYWEYSMKEILEIIGQENKDKFDNLFLVKKLRGEIKYSNEDEYSGGEIADIITEFMSEEEFFEIIFDKRKKENKLKRIVA
jgi:hypothetical protein